MSPVRPPWYTPLARLVREDAASAVVEYALLTAVIAITVAASAGAVGRRAVRWTTEVATALGGSAGGSGAAAPSAPAGSAAAAAAMANAAAGSAGANAAGAAEAAARAGTAAAAPTAGSRAATERGMVAGRGGANVNRGNALGRGRA